MKTHGVVSGRRETRCGMLVRGTMLPEYEANMKKAGVRMTNKENLTKSIYTATCKRCNPTSHNPTGSHKRIVSF